MKFVVYSELMMLQNNGKFRTFLLKRKLCFPMLHTAGSETQTSLFIHLTDTFSVSSMPNAWGKMVGETCELARHEYLTYLASDAYSHRCGKVQSQLRGGEATERHRTSKTSHGLVA